MTALRCAFRRLRELRRDESGAIAPAVAVLGVPLLLSAGLALDVALYYSGNRELRIATEAAALAAAMEPARAQARAQDYLNRNGYSDPTILKRVEVGYYCANINRDSGSRFVAAGSPDTVNCPGSSTVNAVRLTTGEPSRRFLTGALGDASPIPDLAATASAARVDEAGISVTSGLLTVTNTLVNAVNDLLGALIGIKLRLTTADIEALMGGNVDAGLFFDALARRSGQTGTYGQLVEGTYGLQDLVLSAAEAAGDARTGNALRTFGSQVGNGYRVPLSGLFGLGVWKNMPVGEADVKPSLRAGLNAYQLVTYAVQAGPGVIDASDLVSIVAPSSTVRISAVASGHMDRPRFSFGPAGETTVGTSMLRLQVLLGIGRISLLGSAVSVDSVPVLIDVAAARADVAGIDCAGSTEQAQDTRVRVAASTGLVNAYIGTAPANAMTKPIPMLGANDISQARIVNLLGIVTVDARAVAQPVLGNSGTLTFGPGGQGTVGTPQRPGIPASIGNGSQVGATVNGLVTSLTAKDGLSVGLLGLCLPVLCAAQESSVRDVLLPGLVGGLTGLVGSTADPLLDNILAALGVQLGHATVWTNGVRCGVPVLI